MNALSHIKSGSAFSLVAVTLLTLPGIESRSAVLKHSDVVFMYQADPGVYQRYGATALAWGGTPTPSSREENKGLLVFGSVGMVTEFARYYDRFPTTYEQGLCRDINGQPVKVPWLTDHQHHRIPYWWCCTQQPLFRQYLQERVIQTVKAGADGVHIDDHMGTSGGLWLGLCFCDRCVTGFRFYLGSLSAADLQLLNLSAVDHFDFRDAVKRWMAEDKTGNRKPMDHPLWVRWSAYQCHAAASFMAELKRVAAETAGRPIPIGANAGLLWPRHLADYQSLDLFSAETDHHAAKERFSDLPLFAYRLAEAVDRPYASTASGGDWAYIKEHNLPGLVRSWIALSYAAGQCLMVPHRQWCYTPAAGTHWYDGPAEKFAPLYQFVRQHAALLDDYKTFSDVAVLLPHRSFVKNPTKWFELGQQLSANNLSYTLLLAGDELVDHPLSAHDPALRRALLVPDRDGLGSADLHLLEQQTRDKSVFTTLAEALGKLRPAVQVEGDALVRVLPRVKAGAAVIHLVNAGYDPARDDVVGLAKIRLQVDRQALGVSQAAVFNYTDERGSEILEAAGGSVEIPRLGVWGIVSISTTPR